VEGSKEPKQSGSGDELDDRQRSNRSFDVVGRACGTLILNLQQFMETVGNFQQNKTNVSKHDVFVEAVEETVVIYSKSAETVRRRCGSGWESPASLWKRWKKREK